MAVERPYERQVAPEAITPAPLPDAATYGAGVAQEARQVGQQQEAAGLRAYKIERQLTADRELSQGSADLAEWDTRTDVATAEVQANYTPELAAANDKAIKESSEGLFENITDDGVRRQLDRQLTEHLARKAEQSQIYAVGQNVKTTAVDAKRLNDTLTNKVSNSTDPFVEALKASDTWTGYVHGLNYTTEAGRNELIQQQSNFVLAAVDKVAATNWQQVDTMLKSGALDTILDDKQMEYAQRAVANGKQAAEVAQREADREAAAASTAAQKAAADHLGALQAGIENGNPPTLAEINRSIATAKAAGVPEDTLAKFTYMAGDSVLSRKFARTPTTELQVRALGMQHQLDAGELDVEGQHQLELLDKTLDARAASVGKRITETWNSGPAGQEAVLTELHGMTQGERMAATATLSPRIGIVATLDPTSWQTFHQGAEIRKARPTAFLPPKGGIPGADGDIGEAKKQFLALLDKPLTNHLGGAFDDAFGLALDHYVGSQAKGGSSGGWSPAAFAKSVRVVFGGSVRRNGIEQGGIDKVRGRMTELPDKLTADEFDGILSRFDFAKDGAIYSDKKPVDNADVLSRYQPLVVGQSDAGTLTYAFADARGHRLQRAGGGEYHLAVLRDGSKPGGGK